MELQERLDGSQMQHEYQSRQRINQSIALDPRG